jgi:hypothetical protein
VSVGDAGLSARAAQVLYAYARAVDGGDIGALRALALPDVFLTRSDGTKQGIEVFLDLYRAFAASPVLGSKHAVLNVQADSLREVDGQLRFSHKRITVERVVAIPAGTGEYAGVPPAPAGTTAR